MFVRLVRQVAHFNKSDLGGFENTTMRKLMGVCATLTAFSALGMAATWNGTLVDYACYDHHKSVKACGAKPSSDEFALFVNGKHYRFDKATNERAKAAMQSRADRASNPDATKATPVNAKVTGEFKESGKIHAETIEVR
jgi:hypothetical protein